MTHKYIPRIEQTEENLFIEEYYSSTDTKIFMNNVEQTEISYISYQLREQLKPIYGYSSSAESIKETQKKIMAKKIQNLQQKNL